MCEMHANGIACIYMGAHINARTHGQATIHYLCLPCSMHAMRWRIKQHLISRDETLPPQKVEPNFGSGMYIPGCGIKILHYTYIRSFFSWKALKRGFLKTSDKRKCLTRWWNLDNVTRCFHGDQKPVLSPFLVTALTARPKWGQKQAQQQIDEHLQGLWESQYSPGKFWQITSAFPWQQSPFPLLKPCAHLTSHQHSNQESLAVTQTRCQMLEGGVEGSFLHSCSDKISFP